MNKCKTCDKNCEKDYCFRHQMRKPLPKISRMKAKVDEEKEVNNTSDSKEMWNFFLEIWKKRPHRSEISNIPIYGEPSSAYFHHILAKSKYPVASLDEENIIILSLEEHDNVENDIFRYEEVNKRREYLKEKYNL